MEDHECVLVGVAAEEEGTGVAVEWVGDEPHRARHCGDNHLRKSRSLSQSQPEEIIQRQSLIGRRCNGS